MDLEYPKTYYEHEPILKEQEFPDYIKLRFEFFNCYVDNEIYYQNLVTFLNNKIKTLNNEHDFLVHASQHSAAVASYWKNKYDMLKLENDLKK